MSLLNYGTAEGLAYKHDWGTVMQQQDQNEQADSQAKINAQNQTAMMGDALATKTLSTRYDNQQLQQFAQGVYSDMGKFTMANPNWQTNVGQYTQFKNMQNSLTDNQWVRRSMNATTNYQSLIKHIQDNPGSEQDPAVQQMLKQYDNYSKTGSSDGVEANQKDFIFANPDNKFDINADIEANFGKLKGDTNYAKPGQGVGIGATVTAVSPYAIKATAIATINGPNGWRYQNQWNNMSPSEQAFSGGNIIDWLAGLGAAHTETEVKRGEVFKPEAGGGGNGRGGNGAYANGADPFYIDVASKPKWSPIPTAYGAGMIPLQDGKLSVNGGLKLQFTDGQGQPNWSVLNSYNGKVLDAKYNNIMMNDADGVPHAQVTVKIPIQSSSDEVFTGPNPILSDQSHWFESWNADENNDTQINDSWKGIASLEKDKDGNNTGNLIVTGYVPAPMSAAAVQNYNTAAEGQHEANSEGYGGSYGKLAQQDFASHIVRTGVASDGRKIALLDDGSTIDATTGQLIKTR